LKNAYPFKVIALYTKTRRLSIRFPQFVLFRPFDENRLTNRKEKSKKSRKYKAFGHVKKELFRSESILILDFYRKYGMMEKENFPKKHQRPLRKPYARFLRPFEIR